MQSRSGLRRANPESIRTSHPEAQALLNVHTDTSFATCTSLLGGTSVGSFNDLHGLCNAGVSVRRL